METPFVSFVTLVLKFVRRDLTNDTRSYLINPHGR